ncbi:MAG: hypothetical protein U0838_01175 [Chloroflexota bacterium]
MAGLRDAQGDHDAALDLLERAARITTPDFFPDVRPIGSIELACSRAWDASVKRSTA